MAINEKLMEDIERAWTAPEDHNYQADYQDFMESEFEVDESGCEVEYDEEEFYTEQDERDYYAEAEALAQQHRNWNYRGD